MSPKRSGQGIDEWLRIDPHAEHLARQSARGSVALLTSNGLKLVIMIAATTVLARVLAPRDFGLFAMGAVLVSLVDPVKDFGLVPAIVQPARLERDQINHLFWLNLKWTTLLALGFVALAPAVAWFFREPVLVGIVTLLGLGLWFRGSANLQLGLLQRTMRIPAISLIELSALVFGVGVAIVAAVQGAGCWALVLQMVVTFVVEAGILWAVCPWRPQRTRAGEQQSSATSAPLLHYARLTRTTGLISALGNQSDRILLGRFLGAAPLGLYQNALRWANVPAGQILQPLRSVAFPGFSRIHRDAPRYRRYARNIFAIALALATPTLVFLCVDARAVILILLGEQWIAAIPIFQILLAGTLFNCMNRFAIWVYLAEAQSARRLRWTVFSMSVLVAALFAGLSWGAIGVAAAYSLTKALLTVPAIAYCSRTSSLRNRDFWGAAWRPVLASAVAALCVLTLHENESASSAVRVAFDALLFASSYGAVWCLLPGGWRQALELLAMLRQTFGKTAPRANPPIERGSPQ